MSSHGAAVTLHDVAREAGVSLATASRVLNGSTRKVADAYRDRVTAAAERLGYRPNLSAQAVARGTSSTVALVVSDIADPYFSSIAAGVVPAAEAAGLVVTMSVTERDPQRELAVVRALRGQRPRVLVLAGSRFADDDESRALTAELQAYEASGGKVVLVSQHELPFDTVLLDNHAGARRLAVELVDLGYQRFAVIGGDERLLTSGDRVRGFTDGLADRGLEVPAELRVATQFTRDGGYAAAQRLIERGIDDIDAVFAVNDVMAVGALAAFRDAGVAVPEQVAVAGFDDIPTVRDVTPPLTTVHVPLVEVGRAAMRLALGTVAETDGTGPEPEGTENEGSGPGTDGTSPEIGEAAPRDGIVEVASHVVLRESTPRRG